MFNRKLKNNGFSLVEVIVSMLIASVIILGIVTFVSVGTNTYRLTNTETQLQKESQIATNLVDDVMIKAVSYEYYDTLTVDGATVPTLVVVGSELDEASTEQYYYAMILDTKQHKLYFTKEKVSDAVETTVLQWAQEAANDQIHSLSPSLLANYITNMIVTPGTSSSNTDGIVSVTLELELGGKTFSNFSTISLRNDYLKGD